MAQEEETRIPGERAETVTARRIDSNPVLKRGAVALDHSSRPLRSLDRSAIASASKLATGQAQ